MNGFDKRKPALRKHSRQSPRTLWTAALALIATILIITRLNGGSSSLYPKIILGLAIVVLVVRQFSRRSGRQGPKAAEPDPRSRLNLD